ncbi:hypothetical protein [Nocardia arizonensis]|uniref:hypothetical protein n=1 Tax=Nocardia arizonensis TaxID=1141647 RepID=UPI0006CF85F9|nr:hypothetical protein [Nocardia arizonensis]
MTDDQNIVFDDDIMITMRGVSDSVGLPYTVNPMEIVDRQALVEIREGGTGPAGPDGDPAWPWLWQGDIADTAALFALEPTTADARKAWRVVAENSVYYWTGLEFIAFADAFGAAGRKGAPNVLTGSGVAGATGSEAAAEITGAAPNQQLRITFPRGETGDVGAPGGAGRIRDASDILIDDAHPLGQDYVLAWSTALGKFRPVPSPAPAGPWAIASNQFTGGTNLSEAVRTVATATIPAQPVPWRPRVEGGLTVQTHVATLGAARCDIEVRVGGPEGEMVGYGYTLGASNVIRSPILPKFEYAMSPASTLGVVPANQTTTLYVLVRRVGTANYSVITTGAQLIVYAETV